MLGFLWVFLFKFDQHQLVVCKHETWVVLTSLCLLVSSALTRYPQDEAVRNELWFKRQSKVSGKEWARAVCADELKEEGEVKTADPASFSASVLLCVTMTTSNLFGFINKHWSGRKRSHCRLFKPERDKGFDLTNWCVCVYGVCVFTMKENMSLGLHSCRLIIRKPYK